MAVANHQRRRVAVAFCVLVLCTSCKTIEAKIRYGTYRGTVVDDEAGTPIEEAAVVVVWYAGEYFKIDNWVLADKDIAHTVREVATDSEGRFEIETGPQLRWKPRYRLYPWPDLLVFATGYAPMDGGSLIDEDEKLRNGTVIRLRRPEGEREHRLAKRPDLLDGHPEIPPERIPVLTRAVAQYNSDSRSRALLQRGREPRPRSDTVRYLTWDLVRAQGEIETFAGRQWVRRGDRIPGVATVREIDGRRVVLSWYLTYEELNSEHEGRWLEDREHIASPELHGDAVSIGPP